MSEPIPSSFIPSHQFQSPLLPPGITNKPLEPDSVRKVNGLILDASASDLAMHLVSSDLSLMSVRLDRVYVDDIKSGIHLITLVDGRQLREDVMER